MCSRCLSLPWSQDALLASRYLRLNQVLSCPLFLPPLAEQEIIAENLDAMLEETQRLECIYQQKLAALETLRNSLLHQAFTGQL